MLKLSRNLNNVGASLVQYDMSKTPNSLLMNTLLMHYKLPPPSIAPDLQSSKDMVLPSPLASRIPVLVCYTPLFLIAITEFRNSKVTRDPKTNNTRQI